MDNFGTRVDIDLAVIDLVRKNGAEIVNDAYDLLLKGITSDGIERQREIQERINCFNNISDSFSGINGLNECLREIFLKIAQERNDLP